MTDLPQNPGAPGHDETRDDELAARLNTDQIPEHGPTFWSDLEAIFAAETTTNASHTEGRSPGRILDGTPESAPAGAPRESTTKQSVAEVIPLTSGPRRSRMPMILSAAAAVVVLAAGAAVLISRLDNTTSIEAADSTETAESDTVEDDAENDADQMSDGETPSTATDGQTNDGNTPAESGSEDAPGPGCSGAIELEPLGAVALEGVGVPTAIANTVASIDTAAEQCDWAALAALTSSEFTASFGGGDAIELWVEQEQTGGGVMDDLRRVLRQPFAVSDQGEIYTWPAVFSRTCDTFTAEDRRSLADLGYGEEDIDNDCAFVGGYAGYRTGFEPSGEWIFFVAGD